MEHKSRGTEAAEERAVLSMREPATWARIAAIGLILALLDALIWTAPLLGDAFGEVLPLEGHWVGVLLTGGQLAGVAGMLWIASRVSRRRFAGWCCAVVALGAGAMWAWPSGMPLLGSVLAVAVASVGQWAIWSRVIDAVAPDERRQASGVLFTSFAFGVAAVPLAGHLIETDAGVRVLLGVFAVVLTIATPMAVWLCPRDDSHHPHVRPPAPRGRWIYAPLMAAGLLGVLLMAYDSQLTGMAYALGLTRGHAAWSGLATPVTSVIALGLSFGRWSTRGLVLIGAILAGAAFVLVGVAGLLVATPLLVGVLFQLARCLLELGTTLGSFLIPTIVRGAAFMAAVQLARSSGKLGGTAIGGTAMDLGGIDLEAGPAVNPTAVLCLAAVGVVVAAGAWWACRREWGPARPAQVAPTRVATVVPVFIASPTSVDWSGLVESARVVPMVMDSAPARDRTELVQLVTAHVRRSAADLCRD